MYFGSIDRRISIWNAYSKETEVALFTIRSRRNIVNNEDRDDIDQAVRDKLCFNLASHMMLRLWQHYQHILQNNLKQVAPDIRQYCKVDISQMLQDDLKRDCFELCYTHVFGVYYIKNNKANFKTDLIEEDDL